MPVELERVDEPGDDHHSRVPLVLIHDGGGTIFQYYMLGPLHRRTYGISNPYLEDGGKPPVGGVHELAREYLEAIRRTIIQGPLLIGGWSFGGLISLEIARMLQDDDALQVMGLLLIDTSCPWSTDNRHQRSIKPSYSATTSTKTREIIESCRNNAWDMTLLWQRPVAFSCPPAVLIRALDKSVPGSSDDSEYAADAHETLGWSAYEPLEHLSVVHVPGHHFSIFAEAQLDEMTSAIAEACGLLEQSKANGRRSPAH